MSGGRAEPSSLSRTPDRRLRLMERAALENLLAASAADIGGLRSVAELDGGLLNRVWRLNGTRGSVIVKHAPDHVASRPEIELDPVRAAFEARALELFDGGGPLEGLVGDELRPPVCHGFSRRYDALVIEDLGRAPPLDRAVDGEAGAPALARVGEHVARFIVGLHALTYESESAREQFDNAAIRSTRREVQYGAVGDMLADAGVDDAEELGARAVELADRIDGAGCSLVMGDLWPESILVADGGLRLIDWEFADWSWPAQDVAHLAAHAWMQSHRASRPNVEREWSELEQWFCATYRDRALEHEWGLLGEPFERQFGLHFGAELLARTLGAFREGYLYEELELGDPGLEAAVDRAAEALRNPSEQFDRSARGR